MPLPRPLDSRSGPLPFRPLPRSRRGLALRLAVPLAGVAAAAGLAAGLTGPGAVAETAYLAFAAGLVLLAAGAVAERVAVPVLGTAAVVALTWLLPADPARGFLVEGAAALTLGLAVAGRLGRSVGSGRSGRSVRLASTDGLAALLRPVPALGLAFGLQALLRADELLAPPSAAWALVVYAALPAAAACAVLLLARLDGPVPAALAAATVLVLGPGFRPATVTALTALAAAAVLFGERGRLERQIPAGSSLLGLLGRFKLSKPEPPAQEAPPPDTPGRWPTALARVAAALVLAIPAAWSPSAAFVAAVAGGAFALRRHRWAAPVLCLVAAGGAWTATLAWGGRPLAEALPVALAIPLAVPVLIWPARNRIGMAVTAVVLAVVAAIMVSVDGALAAPGALAAASVALGTMEIEEEPRQGGAPRPAAAVQAAWSGILLTGAALVGAYPWLRQAPLDTILGSLGLGVDWRSAVLLPALVLIVIGAVLGAAAALAHVTADWWSPARQARRRAPALAAALTATLAALALLFQIPGTGLELIRGSSPVVLTGPDVTWTAQLPTSPGGPAGTPVGTIVLDSALGNAADLAPGTPVATLALRWVDRPERVWTLRAGTETGEWSTDRSRRLGEAVPVTPPPWRSWIPEEGTFFGHRYRTTLRVMETQSDEAEATAPTLETMTAGAADGAARADRIEIRLRPDLPGDVVLTIFRLELGS